jgi:hypothetical protein
VTTVEEWLRLNSILFVIQNVVYVLLYVGCALTFAIKFRASIPAALLGAASFGIMVVMTGLWTVLPHVLKADFIKVMGFLGFGHGLAVVLLFVALILAPARTGRRAIGA